MDTIKKTMHDSSRLNKKNEYKSVYNNPTSSKIEKDESLLKSRNFSERSYQERREAIRENIQRRDNSKKEYDAKGNREFNERRSTLQERRKELYEQKKIGQNQNQGKTSTFSNSGQKIISNKNENNNIDSKGLKIKNNNTSAIEKNKESSININKNNKINEKEIIDNNKINSNDQNLKEENDIQMPSTTNISNVNKNIKRDDVFKSNKPYIFAVPDFISGSIGTKKLSFFAQDVDDEVKDVKTEKSKQEEVIKKDVNNNEKTIEKTEEKKENEDVNSQGKNNNKSINS